MTNDVEHLSYAYWQFFFFVIVFKENFASATEKNLVASIFFLSTSILAPCHPQSAVHSSLAAKEEI